MIRRALARPLDCLTDPASMSAIASVPPLFVICFCYQKAICFLCASCPIIYNSIPAHNQPSDRDTVLRAGHGLDCGGQWRQPFAGARAVMQDALNKHEAIAIVQSSIRQGVGLRVAVSSDHSRIIAGR